MYVYNIYVKWGEAFSLTHVQHRVIITTLLKWLTFAFDCPKNMNNNIQLPWFNHGELKLFLGVCFWGEDMTGLSRPKQPMTIIKQVGGEIVELLFKQQMSYPLIRPVTPQWSSCQMVNDAPVKNLLSNVCISQIIKGDLKSIQLMSPLSGRWIYNNIVS